MIGMPVEKMCPHLSKGCAYVEFENPDEVEKSPETHGWRAIGGQGNMVTALLPPPTTISTTLSHYPPNSTTPLAIQPTQQTASTASHVAQVTSTDDKEVSFPNVPAPPCIRDLHLPISPQHKSPSSSSSSPQAGTLMRTSVTYVPWAQLCPFSSQNEEDLVGRIPSRGRL